MLEPDAETESGDESTEAAGSPIPVLTGATPASFLWTSLSGLMGFELSSASNAEVTAEGPTGTALPGATMQTATAVETAIPSLAAATASLDASNAVTVAGVGPQAEAIPELKNLSDPAARGEDVPTAGPIELPESAADAAHAGDVPAPTPADLQPGENSDDGAGMQAEAALQAPVSAPEPGPSRPSVAVEWISSTQPAPPAPSPAREIIEAPPEQAGHTLGEHRPEPGARSIGNKTFEILESSEAPAGGGEVAFEGRLQPAGKQQSSAEHTGFAGRDSNSEAALAGNSASLVPNPLKPESADSPEPDFSAQVNEAQTQMEGQPGVAARPDVSSGGAAPYVTATPQPVPAAGASNQQPAAQAPQASLTETPAPAEARSTGTVEEVRVQLGDTPGQRVEVVMSQRNGAVHVTTRTQNNELAQNLRENLPDLVTNLQQRGLQADLWTGSRPTAQSMEGERASAPSPGFSDKNDANESGTMARNYDQPDQSGRRPKQPTWEDLDD